MPGVLSRQVYIYSNGHAFIHQDSLVSLLKYVSGTIIFTTVKTACVSNVAPQHNLYNDTPLHLVVFRVYRYPVT